MHADDLVVEARKAALMLDYELELEAASAVAREVDGQCAAVGEFRLGAGAVALVEQPRGPGLTVFVAQVVAHLGSRSTLEEGLLKARKDIFKLPGCNVPVCQLFEQLS